MIKKYLFPFFFFLFINLAFAQQAYYNGIDFNKTGIALKNDLAIKITTTHTNLLDYTPDVWESCEASDQNPDNNSQVILIYGYKNSTDEKESLFRDKNYRSGITPGVREWNREHVFSNALAVPKLDSNGENRTIYSDAHNLRASDAAYNSTRSNKKYTAGSGNSGKVDEFWYPGDEWKGDVARIVMYMYLHYGDQCKPTFVGEGSTHFTPDDMINLFLQWNAEDPPSVIERQRNDYHSNTSNSAAQGNRNPFIDNPRLATQIWGGPLAQDTWGIFPTTINDVQAPLAPENLTLVSLNANSATISWSDALDDIAVKEYDVYVDDSYYETTTTTEIIINNLNAITRYDVKVIAVDAGDNESNFSEVINFTTLDPNAAPVSDLFISEYVEGSSHNKAIEITNKTGIPVDLNDYKLRIAYNSNDFTSTYSFPDKILANNEVFVMANDQNTLCLDKVNDITTSSVFNFNGNDAIGLFKDNNLIDIVGVPNDNTYFAEDITLIRKPFIANPNITYTESEWLTEATNYCDLGQHNTSTASTDMFELSNVNVYPNPSKTNKVTVSIPNDIVIEKLTLYSILGREIKYINTPYFVDEKYVLENLPKGMYILKLSTTTSSISKKVIIQ